MLLETDYIPSATVTTPATRFITKIEPHPYVPIDVKVLIQCQRNLEKMIAKTHCARTRKKLLQIMNANTYIILKKL